MSLTRRELLKTGAAGVALLTLADCARHSGTLDEAQRNVVAKIAAVMLDGAIPANDPERARAVAEAVAGFAIAVDGLPPQVQGEVQ